MAQHVREHVLAIDKEVKDLEKQIVKLSETLEDQKTKIQDDEKSLAKSRAACQRAREAYDEAWKVHMKVKSHQALAVMTFPTKSNQ
jgi:predicted  nucleic acid-binding Zn-ribbon protein